MISVSRTRLPSLKEYNKYLKRIWKSNWLTNDGELVQELERKLQEYWGVKHVVCVSSGTSALMIAAKALGVKKVYTTPFSFIATIGSMVWSGVKPIFVDCGADPFKKGPVLATHVYGLPHLTDVKPVIYDASHAFDVKHNGKYLVSYGDVSIISFHAVKIFQTVEGGAIVTNNDEIAKKARWMRNHGYKDRYSFHGAGMNAKMSEFHAAMGLCSLKMIKSTRKRYHQIITKYNRAFNKRYKDVTYYPLFYCCEKQLLKAIKKFEENNIFVRRYFYPPLNKVFGGKKCPIAEDLMSKVLCLPLYYDLTDKQVDKIIKIAKETLCR